MSSHAKAVCRVGIKTCARNVLVVNKRMSERWGVKGLRMQQSGPAFSLVSMPGLPHHSLRAGTVESIPSGNVML